MKNLKLKNCLTLANSTIAIAIIFFILISIPLKADAIDSWTVSFDSMLKKYVKPGSLKGIDSNLVDYKGFRNDPLFKQLKNKLENLPSIWSKSRNEQLAFWINVYNFLTINKIVENPGVNSIKDLNQLFTNVWKQTAGIVSGNKVTLNWIEHIILRKKYNEPRIHVAIVCAALSCPDLRAEAYRASKLDLQLEEQLYRLKNNHKKGISVDHKQRIIHISKIFKWFSEDFSKGNVKQWLLSQGLISLNEKKYNLKYFNYDWALNALPAKR